MKLRLFLDEDIHTGLSHALQQRGYDVVHAQDLIFSAETGIISAYFADNSVVFLRIGGLGNAGSSYKIAVNG